MKVLNYGSLNVDFVYSVPHIARPGETLSSTSMTRSAGGKGANQSASMAKAGLRVYHAGKMSGKDQWLVDLLRSYGVDTSYIRLYEGTTGHAIIQLDAERQNCIVLYAGGNGEVTLDEIAETLSHFEAGDLLVLQNEIVHVDALIRQAHEKGMRICLNPAPFDDSIFNLPLEAVDLLVVNEIEGAQLARLPLDTPYATTLDSLVSQYPHAEILLTAGKAGAFYGYGTIREQGEIIDLPVADTTGAGDTFIGYYLASVERGYSVKDALRLACKASSIAVSRFGAMESIPFAQEVF